MKNIHIILIGLFCGLVLGACHTHSHDEGDGHDHGHDHGAGGHEDNLTTIGLTASQVNSIKVSYGKIEKKQLSSNLKLNGKLIVHNNYRANVSALAGGIVKSIQVQPGAKIGQGQVIATLTNTNLIAMQEEYLSTLAKLELAQHEYDRQKSLKEENVTSLKIYQQAEAELKSLKAKKAGLQQQLTLIGVNVSTLSSENLQSTINVLSPISGTISKVAVTMGAYVDANAFVAEIIDDSQIHLDLFVYEKDLPKIQIGQEADFVLTNNPKEVYRAKIISIGSSFEADSKAIVAHTSVIGNKKGLIDGMLATVTLALGNNETDVVPTEAIVNHEGKDYIFILTDAHTEAEHHGKEASDAHQHDEHGHAHEHGEEKAEKPTEPLTVFEIIPVKIGISNLGYTEIALMRDIPRESKIVTNGAFFILGKMTNQGEGHSH